ncbi:MAG: thioredoxin [Bacteroidales bacterium]
MALQVTDSNFDELILNSGKPALVDFWAEWCGPCRMIAPYVEQIAEEYKDKAVVAKVDVDNCPGIAARYGIRNIPTVLFFKDGQQVDKQVGAVPKNNLIAKLEALL